jgi:hypothetical protein
MSEKVYKTMKSSGICNIVLGICSIILGVGIGVTTIINGAILLKKKSHLLF